jgi:lysophospholipase L1-like esterase
MKLSLGAIAIGALLAACVSDSPSSASSQQRANPPSPIVFTGDSITQFWEDGDPQAGFPTASPTLDERLQGAVDVGIAGQVTSQMLARFQTDVLTLHPSVVVILGGTNDLHALAEPTTDDVAQMAAEAAAAGAKVILGTLPPSDLGDVGVPGSVLTEDQVQSAEVTWNESITSIAAANGYLVADYYTAMLLPDGTQDKSLFLPDAVHPNDAGYAVMWRVLSEELQTDAVAPPMPPAEAEPE